MWRLVAAGLSNAEVARSLLISGTTVQNPVASLLGELGVHDRVQAVVAAYGTGRVRPGTGPDDAATALR